MIINQTAGQSLPWCYSDLDKQKQIITQYASIPTNRSGNFNYSTFSSQNTGKYTITIYPIESNQSRYSIPIEVVNPFLNLTAYLLYAAIIFFILLMITNVVPARKEKKDKELGRQQPKHQNQDCKKDPNSNEEQKDGSKKTDFDWLTIYRILRFIFISGLVISVIVALGSTDVEVGTNSPVGLVLQQLSDKNGNPIFDKNSGLPVREWVINVGGHSIGSNSSFVISIPYYIIVLGLTGGYLRYLSKAASNLYL